MEKFLHLSKGFESKLQLHEWFLSGSWFQTHFFMFFSPYLYLKGKSLYFVIAFEQVSTIKESTLQ